MLSQITHVHWTATASLLRYLHKLERLASGEQGMKQIQNTQPCAASAVTWWERVQTLQQQPCTVAVQAMHQLQLCHTARNHPLLYLQALLPLAFKQLLRRGSMLSGDLISP